ncbi:hypothetical protein [Nocardiopsis sp. NPDC058789]|uniref:hypothetical protein n=1 Tax=Nocardiopsis sp. NPDC058789 TaxID=3346634 RepID=UPI00367057ED
MLLRVAYWSGTGLGVVGGLTLLVVAAAINSHHQSQLADQAQDGFDAQRNISVAEQGLEDLPSEEEAGRWLSQATSVGATVAEVQNTYLEQAGPLSLDGLPERTPGLGERDECVTYLDERPTSPREYSNEELTTCAQALREAEIGGLDRHLTPHFAAHVRDDDGFNAVAQWHSGVAALDELEEGAFAADYSWTVHEAKVFERDGSIPMVWTLTHEETGQLVAWMHGTYDPVVKKFDRMVLGTVAVGTDEEVSEPGSPGADSGEDVAEGESGDENEGGGDQG